MSALLNQLLAGYAPAPELEVTGVETDSRRVTPGDLFLAVRGVGSHGLQYVETALERGASAVVWEPAPGIAEPDELPVPQMPVPQLSLRVGEIAARFHGHPADKLFTVGVTGTDGKTSTVHLVAQALDALGQDCAYLGTLGYGRLKDLKAASHTTPDAIRLQKMLSQFVEQGLRAAAMETSSHALHQARVAGIGYDVAVLTNVTRDHLDYHGTVAAYAAAKKLLFTQYTRGAVVLNRDDATGAAWLAEFAKARGVERVTAYGLDGDVLLSPLPPGRERQRADHASAPASAAPQGAGEGAHPIQGSSLVESALPHPNPLPEGEGIKTGSFRYVWGRKLKLSATGLALDIDSSWGAARLETRLLGRFNAYNLLAALAVLLHKGVALAEAVRVLNAAHTVPGRIEGFHGPKAQALAVVDYAHTPEALSAILSAVRAHCQGRLWCVFGCGGDRDRGKRPLMGAVAAKQADVVIVTDDNPRSESAAAIAAEILAAVPAARLIHDRALAIATALREAVAGDVVVIAGKGHETTQTYGSEVREFSDRVHVAQLVGVEERA